MRPETGLRKYFTLFGIEACHRLNASTIAKYLAKGGVSGQPNIAIEAVITESGSDSTMIVPMDSNNTHYQAILEWVDAGNTITAAD